MTETAIDPTTAQEDWLSLTQHARQIATEMRNLAGRKVDREREGWFTREADILSESRDMLPQAAVELERMADELDRSNQRFALTISERLHTLLAIRHEDFRRIKALEYIADANIRAQHVATSGVICYCWRCSVNRALGQEPFRPEPPIPSNTEVIRVGPMGTMHPVGMTGCPRCVGGHPVTHEGCGGLKHASYGDEMAGEGEFWLYTICDRCGGSR